MIDLRGTYVRVDTREECEKLFEIARGQRYIWSNGRELIVFKELEFPNIFYFRYDKTVIGNYSRRIYIAAEILDKIQVEEEEMTARKFIEGINKYMSDCVERGSCLECPLYCSLTDNCGGLCRTENWKGHEEKLIKLVEKKLAGMTEAEAVGVLQKHFDNGSCKTPEEQEAIKLAIKKLRGE